MAHVRKGDQVVVLKGREKGKRGAVKRVVASGKRVEVEKVMMVKRHTKPTQKNPQGGIVDKEAAIDISNVALWCDKCNAARRHKMSVDDKGRKQRVCAKCDTAFQATAA